MNIHWKIFNVVNLICLTLVTGTFAWPLITHPNSINRRVDYFFYAFIILILLVVIINCLHNMFLTRLLAERKKITLRREIWFWILYVLFAAMMCIFIYYTCREVYFVLTPADYQHPPRMKYLPQIISISATELYIVITQAILFFKIKRSYRRELDNSVNEIGNH